MKKQVKVKLLDGRTVLANVQIEDCYDPRNDKWYNIAEVNNYNILVEHAKDTYFEGSIEELRKLITKL